MKLSISVDVEANRLFSHRSRYLLLGSCFATNMGNKLLEYRFEGINNPFGILFNPISIAEGLERILYKKYIAKDDLFFYNGLWHSELYHGSYSDADAHNMLARANDILDQSADMLAKAEFLILTFGSSWVYQKEGRVVANCHKLPESVFSRYRLSVDEIVERYVDILGELFSRNPSLKVILTVSPVRYMRDGAFDNSLNKSVLLLAVERLIKLFPNAIYFPAYEIVIDELRDYRFYADDMLHPSSLTQSIIWQRFSSVFFTEETLEMMPKIDKLNKMMGHKILKPHSSEATTLAQKISYAQRQLNDYFAKNGLL